MKTLLATMLGLLLLALSAHAQLVFTVNISGNASSPDRFAALFLINRHNNAITQQNNAITADNEQITAENQQRALEEPPLKALPTKPLIALLPISTNAELKASYATLLEKQLNLFHEALSKQQADEELREALKARWHAATPEQRAAALSSLPALP